MATSFLSGLLASLALALPACAQRAARSSSTAAMLPYQTQPFHLSAGPCAAKGYHMTIQVGAFVRSDEKTFPVPSGHYLRGDWGASSISWSVGDENQPAPASLEILYFSFTEDKFYEGHFALPQQRIHDLLQAGFWDTDDQQHVTYDKLVVCVLPKGMVCVWLSGGGNKVLIGRFQGSVSDADFKQFYPKTDRAEMFQLELAKTTPAVQQQMKAGTISTKQWDEYLRTYNWQLAFSEPLTLTKYYVSYLNAEINNYPATRDLAPHLQELLTPHTRAVPRTLSLYVRDEAGHAHLLRTRAFDEAETMAAFATLHQASPSRPLTLRVETDKYVKKASFVLTDGVKSIPLTKTVVEVVVQD
jgi:hypothetical protein